MNIDEINQRYQLRTELFKALANPVRLFLLDCLGGREWCVCELAKAAGISKSAASKHLSQMKEAGLLSDRKQGTQVLYTLVAPCLLSLAECAEQAAKEQLRRRLG